MNRELKLLLKNKNRSARGQSFVELALVVSVLMLMLVGIVEYGFLLNEYLNLVDATRETARKGANIDPFLHNPDGSLMSDGSVPPNPVLDPNFLAGSDVQCRPSLSCALDDPPGLADYIEDFLEPLVLHMEPDAEGNYDDVVISFFSVDSALNVVRYPQGEANGWSYAHALDTTGTVAGLESRFDDADIAARMNNTAPPTGVLLIEVFYNYHQVLHLPILRMADPIQVYSYAIMPLSAAEPPLF